LKEEKFIGGLLSGKNYAVGLGARPGRAGSPVPCRCRASIGLSISEFGFPILEFYFFQSAFCIQQFAFCVSCPIYGETTALIPAEWTGAQTMGTLGILVATLD
jgi:hypothetical protein